MPRRTRSTPSAPSVPRQSPSECILCSGEVPAVAVGEYHPDEGVIGHGAVRYLYGLCEAHCTSPDLDCVRKIIRRRAPSLGPPLGS